MLLPSMCGNRWRQGLCSYWIGQELTEEVYLRVRSYFNYASDCNLPIPAWAVGCVWYHEEWPLDYRPELDDFGIPEAYHCFARDAGPSHYVFEFPQELTERLSNRARLLAYLASDEAPPSESRTMAPTRPSSAMAWLGPLECSAMDASETGPVNVNTMALGASGFTNADHIYVHDKGPLPRLPHSSPSTASIGLDLPQLV